MTEMLNISSRRFDAAFRESFRDLVLWRRDVRRFCRE
jgi:5,6-dimethylbenzimidazole synthase